MIIDEDVYLEHFGIKGMKWGVRKPRTFSEEKTRAVQKIQKDNFKKEMGVVVTRRFEHAWNTKPMSIEDYNKLSTRGKTWVKGQEFHRVVAKRNKDAPDRYVSTNKQDAWNYRVGLGQRFLGVGERHEVTLKTIQKLSSPSEKERVDAFISLMDTKSIVLKNGKTISGRQVLKNQGYTRDVKRLDAIRLGLKYYNTFLEEQWMDKPINTAYFDSIAKRGYNAVIDDNDRLILAKEPLILLNPNGSVKRMSIKPLSKQEVKDAQNHFKAPKAKAS